MNGNSLVNNVSGAFGMRAVAVRNKFYLLEVTASAAPRIADKIFCFARRRRRLFDTESVRLRCIETKRNRDVNRFFRIEFNGAVIKLN